MFVKRLLGIGWHWCVIWLNEENEEVNTSIGKEQSRTDLDVYMPGQVPLFLAIRYSLAFSFNKRKVGQAGGGSSTIDMQIKQHVTQLELTKLTTQQSPLTDLVTLKFLGFMTP